MQGEIVRPMAFLQARVFPQTVFILRLEIVRQREQKAEICYLIDFEAVNNYKASGRVIKIQDEAIFLDQQNPIGLHSLVSDLARNGGRLRPSYRELFEDSADITLSKFKHVYADKTNWVINALNNVGIIL